MIPVSLEENSVTQTVRCWGLAVLGSIALLTHAGDASAEEEGPTSAAAELLFVQGRDLMREHRYDEACSAFEQSERLEPASGTLLNLGVCREAQGRTASAFRSYRAGLALGQVEKNGAAERLALERLSAVEPRLCRLVLSIRRPRPGLDVRLDGVPVQPSSWGKPEPIDPGSHRVESSASDQKPWSTTFSIEAAGTVMSIDVESPPASFVAPGTQRGVVESTRSSRVEVGARSAPALRGNSARSWPLVLSSGVAVASTVGTVYFGFLATKEWDRRNDHCPEGQCDRVAVLASQNAYRYARAADVALGVAALSGAAAISLFIFEKARNPSSGANASVRLASRGPSFDIVGTF